MKKSILAAFVATALVFGGGSAALAAGPAKPAKVTCASAHKALDKAKGKAAKDAAKAVVKSVCAAKKASK